MDSQNPRSTIERIDYGSAFRFTRIFECFGMAIQPARLMLALMLIACLFITGLIMNQLWGPQVLPGEFDNYVHMPTEKFVTTRDQVMDEIDHGGVGRDQLERVFTAAFHNTLELFEHLVRAAVNLRPGFDQLSPGAAPDETTVLGTLRVMSMLPIWLWTAHRSFLIVYMILFLLLWSLFAGAITRSALCDAARGQAISATESFAFSWRRWLWFLLAPLLPLVVVGVLGGLLALGGLLLLNLSVLDIIGALGFAVALAIGFIMALLLIGWVAGVHLMYPALAAEDSDAFDAVSRGYSYVFARPWRFIFYSLISLVYGAITYLFVGLFIFAAIWLTHAAVGTLVFGQTAEKQAYFNSLFPPPVFGNLTQYHPDYEHLNWSGSAAATIIMVWVFVMIGIVGAYAINFYLCSYSVIYLLLRRYTDGTDPGEVAEAQPPHPPADKIEPAPAAAPGTPANMTSAQPGVIPGAGSETPDKPQPDMPDEQ